MKSCLKYRWLPPAPAAMTLLAVALFAWAASLRAEPPLWLQHIVAHSAVEAAFFRNMLIPGGAISAERAPAEVRAELSKLIAQNSSDAELYSLRGMEDERQLDFVAAEADWLKYRDLAQDKSLAGVALADFFHRRIEPGKEIAILATIGSAPSPAAERLTPAAEQRSWQAFERILRVIQEQGVAAESALPHYRAWIARYPQEPAPYARFFNFLLQQKRYRDAGEVISSYQRAFPSDNVFPIEAHALLEYGSGSAEKGLAVYERSFQPLWPPELIKNYFDLLKATHRLRSFLDRTRAQIASHPDDLAAASRLFYYYQQQGDMQAAKQALGEYRRRKETGTTRWTPDELYVMARLMDEVHDYPEAARYYYALYSAAVGGDGAEHGLAGAINVLLTAPEQPIRLGAGDLSLYRDIATMDPYPGYWNGLLSLLFNSAGPKYEFSDEEHAAVPYFHRAKAAELLLALDQRFPQSKQRPALHAQLIEAYARYGQNEAVIREGKQFLNGFPQTNQRITVALLMADAFARIGSSTEEFAIYDVLLQELSAQANGLPIGLERASSPTEVSTGLPRLIGPMTSSGASIIRRKPSIKSST